MFIYLMKDVIQLQAFLYIFHFDIIYKLEYASFVGLRPQSTQYSVFIINVKKI
jgi:hypothetical protein